MNANSIKKMMFLLVCALCGANMYGQIAYKGQLYLSGENFNRQGDLLHIHMKVTYDNTAINTDESLILTPVLKTEKYVSHLPSVVVDGHFRSKVETRAAYLKHRLRKNIPIVVKENKRGTHYFVYDVTVPYKKWMDASAMFMECEDYDYKGKRLHLFEDRLLKQIPLAPSPDGYCDVNISDAELASLVQFIRPDSLSKGLFIRRGVIPLCDPKELAKLNLNGRNKAIYGKIFANINDALQCAGTQFTGMKLTEYGAPVGDDKRSERETMKRALALKKYMMEHHIINNNSLEVAWVSEDWEKISELVGNSDFTMSDAILNIIHSVDIKHRRESILKDLDDGLAYDFLSRYVFPKVCRIEYTLTFNRPEMTMGTYRTMVKHDPENMSLNDFYTMAVNAETIKERNDVMYLASRFYPDSINATVNAAAAALTVRNTKLARKYLQNCLSSPKSYNNMGLLYLLEGNIDKAEVYLHMANSAGVRQAASLLDIIRTKQEQLSKQSGNIKVAGDVNIQKGVKDTGDLSEPQDSVTRERSEW